MSEEVPLEEARKILGDLADRARHARTTTILTRRGRPIAAITPLENTMTTTTQLGSWQIDSTASVEDYVASALGEFSSDYDLDAITADLRTAINENLPEGVSLHGNELYGQPGTEVDLTATIDAVDFWAIAAHHDKTA